MTEKRAGDADGTVTPIRTEPGIDPPEPISTGRVPLVMTDHQGLDVLSTAECHELLDQQTLGRVGFNDRGQTVILPVNYAFVAGSILFRTAPGSKLDLALRSGPASFEVDDWDVKARTGWSVLVKGRAEAVTDEWLVSLCEHFDVDPWADQVPRDDWVRISAEEVTGRWINRPHRTTMRVAGS